MSTCHPLHFNLVAAAHAAMIEHGFQPDFPAGTDSRTGRDRGPSCVPACARRPGPAQPALVLDRQRHLQGSRPDRVGRAAARRPHPRAGRRGRRGCRVCKGTAMDSHAQSETTSVYTGVKVFPMLPAELSEGITSLNENEDRVALVIEFAVDAGRHCIRWQGLPGAGAQPRATGLQQRGRLA